MPLRVGVDCDGVLFNFGDSVKRYLDFVGLGHLWKSGPNQQPYWEFYKDWGWTGREFVELCDAGVDAGYIFSGPARANAVESMQKLAELGHEIVIITDRSFGKTPLSSQTATVEWLDQHGIWYDELIFSADKTVGNCDIFVEDKYDNAIALEAAGTETWLITRAWNKDKYYDKRICDISDFPGKVALKEFKQSELIR